MECEVGGRDKLRLDRPCENDASEKAGELSRVCVCARGREEVELVSGRLVIGGVTSDEVFEVTLLVRCLDENVVPNGEELPLELEVGPDTDRIEDAIERRLELLVGGPVLTEEPEAARRAFGFGSVGTRNFGDADSFEKLPFLSRPCRGRETSKLARIRGLSVTFACEELLMTEARLLRPELMTLAGRDFCPLIRSSAMASSSDQVCKMRSCSAGTRGSSESSRANVFKRDSDSRVKASRAESCSSGTSDGSDL